MARRYKLLVVDDEERVLRALNGIFKKDYDVYTCSNAIDALRVLSRHAIDVLISDDRMPVTSGTELLGKVQKKHPEVIRILLTGSFDKAALSDAVAKGKIFGYVGKPWNLNSMKALVERAVDASVKMAAHVQNNTIEAGSVIYPSTKPVSSVTKPAIQKMPAVRERVIETLPVNHSLKTRSRANAGKSVSIILFDKDERVRAQVRKLGAHLKITIYAVNAFEQAIRILALRPDIGLVMWGVAEDAKKTDVALRVMRRYRDDLTIVAMANTSSIGQAVNLVNNGRAFRHLHRLADIHGFRRVMLSAVKHHILTQRTKKIALGHDVQDSPDRIFSRSTMLYMNSKKRSSEAVSSGGNVVASPAANKNKASIVLVERDQQVRNSVHAISKELGFNVHPVSSFVQARAALTIHSDIGVVVVGVSACPEKSTAELNALKRLYNDICILAVTDSRNLDAVAEMVNNGLVFRYLQTPLDVFDFERAMQAAIKHAQMQQKFSLLKKQREKPQETKLVLMKQTA
ncbi:MAG: response regulator [Cellvibrionaceae bacterium]